MKAALVTIGDEILIGQIVDTNSAWLGQQLNLLGISVNEIRSVSDTEQGIIQAMDELIPHHDLILVTGGLGPTKDDITKKVLADYFGGTLFFDEDTFKDVAAIFERKGRTVSDINRSQAMVPDNCELLKNNHGTAKGMWFQHKGVQIVSMPGVPYEMQGILSEEIIPRLQERFDLPALVHRTFLTQGIPESILAEKLESWEASLPEHMKLAFLPSPGKVRLRISAMGVNKPKLEAEVALFAKDLYELIGKHIYGEGETLLEQVVGDILLESGQTMGTAESCTGGKIAHKITSCPGSSAYFMGAVIAYDYAVKEDLLEVPKALLQKYGAVSEEVVTVMAQSAQKQLKVDWSIAVSGIAGPGGGTNEKPVGTIWLAICGPNYLNTKKLQLGGHRERNIEITSLTALNQLRIALLEKL